MYIPEHFKVTDKQAIIAFIEANAFGQLMSSVEGRLFSTHMPFILSDDGCKLIGHIARQNPQWQDINKQEVLASLQGPHDYISPTWYSTPGVPTWNYQAVHIYGQCTAFHDSDQLKQLVHTLTEKYESSSEQPWQPTYKEALLQAIVGIEIEITEIQCKYKLSQNRSRQDQIQVARQLEASGSHKLSQAMGIR